MLRDVGLMILQNNLNNKSLLPIYSIYMCVTFKLMTSIL